MEMRHTHFICSQPCLCLIVALLISTDAQLPRAESVQGCKVDQYARLRVKCCMKIHMMHFKGMVQTQGNDTTAMKCWTLKMY